MNQDERSPFNLEVEAAVLSSCMLSEAALDEVTPILTEESWYAESHRWVWRAMRALSDNHEAVDPATIAEWLNARSRLKQVGGSEYLAQLTDSTPAVANVTAHAEIVLTHWRNRAALKRFDATSAAIRSGATQDPAELKKALEETEAFCGHLLASNTTSGLLHLSQHLAEADAAIEETRERGAEISGTATGFAKLDSKISGLMTKNLYIMAGRPGMGKTAFITNMARTIAGHQDADGHFEDGVAFFSLEMPGEQVALRLVSAESKVEFSKLRSASGIQQHEWTAIAGANLTLGRLPLWIDDDPAATLSQIRSRVRKLKSEIANGTSSVSCRRLFMVAIDYLQFMNASSAGRKTREQEIAELTKGLKQLAKQEEVAVVVLSQLNRGVESRPDKRPMLSDLRESGAIEQEADAVLFLFRPAYYWPDDATKQGWCDVIIAKQRNGPTGSVRVAFQGAHMFFRDFEPGEGPDEYDDDFDDG